MKQLIERPIYLNKLKGFMNTDLIKIITGVRRCGKSTLFKIFQKFLFTAGVKREQIIDINLENAEYKNLLSWEALHNFIKNKLVADKTNYIFIDEIQNVAEFEKAVNSLNLDSNVDLYITGSNATMFSSDIATLISGRYVEIKMLPLSFKEYMSAQNNKTNLPQKFKDYVELSSFPAALQFEGNKEFIDDYVRGIYNTIVLKDIVARKKISDVAKLESVIRFMFSIIGSETSVNNIYKTLKVDGREVQNPTIESYLSSLIDSFILYRVGRFDVRGKQLLKTNDKYYVVDIGFRNLVIGRDDRNWGHILENIVYFELLRRGYEVYIGKVGNAEVDFIARKNGNIEYYQVSQSIIDSKTFDREVKPLNDINDHNPKFILSMDYIPTSHNGIKQLNVLDWLMD